MEEDDMLPPPPRAQPKKLTNADFRALMTPRPGATPDLRQQQRDANEERKAKPRKQHRPKPKQQEEGKGEEDEVDEGPKYRDRAEERRRGINPDYDPVTSDLASIMGQGVAVGELSIEDSKFLGGDVDHTHLVKGLDFALLQKVKGELHPAGGKSDAAEAAAKRAAQQQQQQQQWPISKPSSSAPAKFVTPLGQAVYSALFKPQRLDVAGLFLPRRTAFVYELDEGGDGPLGGPDIPTTLRRSKADCPPVKDCMLGAVDSRVLERLAKIVSYVRVSSSTKGGPGGKKLKKKERQALMQQLGLAGVGADAGLGIGGVGGTSAAVLREAGVALKPPLQQQEADYDVAPKPVDEDEDIFGDAGTDYVPDIPTKKTAAAGNGVARAEEEEEEGAMLPPPPLPPPPPPLPPPPSEGPARPPPGYDAAAAYGHAEGDDMELEEGEVPELGPSRPPAGYAHADAAYFYPEAGPAPGAPAYPEARAAAAAVAAAYPEADEFEAQMRAEAEAEAGGGGGGLAVALGATSAGEATASGRLVGDAEDAVAATLEAVYGGDAAIGEDARSLRRQAAAGEGGGGGGGGGDGLDAYAECYPEYHGFAQAVVDSDEEADFSQMDSKDKGASRADFNTEEEWQEYKAGKEQTPRAAFQFGVKAGDGRRQPRGLARKADAKLSTELGKIRQMMDDKYGSDAHKSAFAREKGGKRGGGGAGQGGGDDAPVVRSKRLRL